jgi:hypothetical protein
MVASSDILDCDHLATQPTEERFCAEDIPWAVRSSTKESEVVKHGQVF